MSLHFMTTAYLRYHRKISKNLITRVQPTQTIDNMASQQPLLVGVYNSYVSAINSRHWDVVRSFIHPVVVWNGKPYPAEEYIRLITRGTDPVPDTVFHIDMLVVDDDKQTVAARLMIRGTPIDEFLGLKPNGKEIELLEHAFYVFEDGRVKEVKTILDIEGLSAQMQPSS